MTVRAVARRQAGQASLIESLNTIRIALRPDVFRRGDHLKMAAWHGKDALVGGRRLYPIALAAT
jgi:hypothetical protein